MRPMLCVASHMAPLSAHACSELPAAAALPLTVQPVHAADAIALNRVETDVYSQCSHDSSTHTKSHSVGVTGYARATSSSTVQRSADVTMHMHARGEAQGGLAVDPGRMRVYGHATSTVAEVHTAQHSSIADGDGQ